MWFNQVSAAPMPEYKKAWFRSKNFRNAVLALHPSRGPGEDRLQSLATPAAGPISPANRLWYKPKSEAPRL